jgi:hypothetical protein
MSTGTSQPENTAAPERTVHPAFKSPMLRQTLIAFSVAVAVACVAYFALSKRRAELAKQVTVQSEGQERPEGSSAAPAAPAQHQVPEPHIKPPPQDPKDVIGEFLRKEARATDLVTSAIETREIISKLQSGLQSFRQTYLPLKTNDAGRRIAAHNLYSLEMAVFALQRERPSDDLLASWRIEIDILAQPFEKPSHIAEHFPSSYQRARVLEIQMSANKALKYLQSDVAMLDSLLKDTAEVKPYESTIEEIARQWQILRERVRFAELARAEQAAFAVQTANLRKTIEERAARDIEAERKNFEKQWQTYQSQ